MKSAMLGRVFTILGASALLNGCGLTGDWFPDKQKQYQYSTEIPALEIPPDLTASTVEGATLSRRRSAPEPASDQTGTRDSEPAERDAPEERAVEPPRPRAATRPKSTADSVLAQNTDNVPLIEIEAPFGIAWNDVAKALGRLELEVSDQNRSDGVYFVYYGGDRKPYEDRGFFGDVVEMFGGSAEPAREYRVKLEDKGQTTLVYVLDADNQPQTGGAGYELLTRLHETLKALSEPGKNEKAKAPAGEKPASEDGDTETE